MLLNQPSARSSRNRRTWLWGIAGLFALFAAQQLGTIPGDNLFARTLTNSLHIPWFALLSLLIWSLFANHGPLWVLGVASALAVASEALQIFTPRDASWLDLGLDLIGASIVALGIALYRASRRTHRRWVRAWTISLALLLGTTLAAPGWVYLAYLQRDRLFPRLMAVDSRLQSVLMESNSPLHRVAAPKAWANFAGRPVYSVRWADVQYPGIEFKEVVDDWRCCRNLVLELFVPGTQSLPVTAAVGHPGILGTARYVTTAVPPGAQRIEIPLTRLGAAGEDAQPITKLIVHTSRDYAGRELLIADIYLR